MNSSLAQLHIVKFLPTLLVWAVLWAGFFVSPAEAQFTEQINYQGKLNDNLGVPVSDGNYEIRFRLYTVPSGGSAIWTEVQSVTVNDGLFSHMLGSSSSISAINFNQPLYLGVEVAGDGEMSPRKIVGAVPSALEAGNTQTFDGLATTSFLRSDQADTATGLLTFSSGLISSASSTIANLTTVFATTTNLTINNERFTDLTGYGLSNAANVLSVDTTVLDSRYASSSNFDTESELETLLTDVTNVFTNNDTIDLSDNVNFAVSATGLTLSDDTLTLTAGYSIPLVASTTEWTTFYDTPSTRITAGTGISWSGNTLNAEVESSDLASFGSDNQIPFTNAGGDDFEYDAGFTFDGGRLTITEDDATPVSLSFLSYGNDQNNLTTDVVDFDTGYTINGVLGPYNRTGNSFLINDTANLYGFNADGTVSGSSFRVNRSWGTTNLPISVTGPVAYITDDCNPGSGTCNSSADVLRLGQGYSDNTGAVLNLTSSTTNNGLLVRVNDDGTYEDSSPFVIDQAGSVGIGTTSPISRLDVWGDLRVGTSSVPSLLVDTSANQTIIGTTTAYSASTFGLYLEDTGIALRNSGNLNRYGSLSVDGSGLFEIDADQEIEFYVEGNGLAANEKLSITSSGVEVNPAASSANDFRVSGGSVNNLLKVDATTDRVGVATGTPIRTFSVAGDAIITGALYDNSNNAGTSGMVLQTTGTGFTWVATSSLGFTDTNTQLTQEEVQDFVGTMVAGNTETLIAVTYDDTDDEFDFVVENDLSLFDNSTSAFLTSVNNGNWSGTDLAVVNGGTGASTAGDARTNLGVAIGSDVQAFDTTLDDIADGTILENLVNTANPWADNEVSDTLTIGSGGSVSEAAITPGTDGFVLQTVGGTSTWVATSTLGIDGTDTTLTEEEVEDFVGGMLGGTESGISVTYQDSTNDIDFVVDNVTPAMLNNEDFGDFTCNGTTCSLDADTVSTSELAPGIGLSAFTDDVGFLTDITGSSFLDLDDTPGSFITNRVLYMNGSSVTSDADLTFDGTSLGIGTTSPTALLTVGAGTFETINGTDDLYVTDDVEVDGQIFVAGNSVFEGNLVANAFDSDTDTNAVVRGDTNVIIHLDEDNDGSNTFNIRDGANSDVFVINESGQVTTGVWQGSVIDEAYLDADVSALGSTINATEMASEDFGDFTCNGTTCSLDADTVSTSELAPGIGLSAFTDDVGFLTDITGSSFLDLSDTPGSFITNRVLYMNGSSVTNSTNLIFDGTNLGIGTSTPGTKLDIYNGSARVRDGVGNYVSIGAGLQTGQQGLQLTYDNSNNASLIQSIDQGTSFRSLGLNAAGGNVGIGTTSPTALLTVGAGTFETINGTDDLYVTDDVEVDGQIFVAGASTFDSNLVATTFLGSTDSSARLQGDINVIIDLDNDNDGSGSFLIRDGANSNIFNINESGQVVTGEWQGTAIDDTYVSDTLTIGSGGSVDEAAITPGTDGFVLQTVGGTASWVATSSLGIDSGSSVSFGSDNQIPFVNAGGTDFDYSPDFTYDLNTLTVEDNATFGRDTNTDFLTRTVAITGARSGSGSNYAQINLNNYDGADYTGARIASENDGAVQDGNLAFYTADAGVLSTNPQLVIDSTGNVGIGTTTPERALSVVGRISVSDGSTQGEIYMNSSQMRFAPNETLRFYMNSSEFRSSNGVGGRITHNQNSASTPVFSRGGDSNTGMYFEGDDNVAFTTGGVFRGLFDENGNFAVGTTSPQAIMHVAGANGDDILIESSDADGQVGFRMANDAREWRTRVRGANADSFEIRDVTAGANRLVIDTSGNVGIGVDSPSALLDVTSAAADTYAAELVNTNVDGFGAYVFVGNADVDRNALQIDNSVGGIVTVRNSGNVGIGTTSPTALLTVGAGDSETINGTDDLYVTDDIEVDGSVFVAGNSTFDGNLTASIYNGSTDAGAQLRGDTNVIIHLDEDNDGSNNFTIRDGANTDIFEINESGQVTTGVWQGSVIDSAYIDVTGDWTGTLDGIEGANFLRSDTADSASGLVTFLNGIAIGSSNVITHNATDARDKIRVWNTDVYTIGMDNNYTFGALNNNYAMTFQMNNNNARGFWWGDETHTNAQGAMALNTTGDLTVAESVRVGYGQTDTTVPGTTYALDVSGNANIDGSLVIADDIGNSIDLSTQVGNSNDSTFTFYKSRGGSGSPTQITTGDDLGTINFTGYDGSAYQTAAYIQADSTANTGNLGGVLGFGTNGSLRLLINESGNSVFSGHLYPSADNTYDIGQENGTNEWRNAFFDGTVRADTLRSDTDVLLQGGDLYDNSGDFAVRSEDNLYLVMDYNNDDANTRSIIFTSNDGLGDFTPANEVMRVQEDGNVGIGTSTPQERLSITGNFNLTGIINAGNGSSTALSYNRIGSGVEDSAGIDGTDGENDLYITDDLEVDGTFYLAGGSTAIVNSDVAEVLLTKRGKEYVLCNGDPNCTVDGEFVKDELFEGELVCINSDEGQTIARCTEAYAQNAVGFISNTAAIEMGNDSRIGYPIAVAGVVEANVTNVNGDIKPGDLLVAAERDGFAMKMGSDKRGAVVGKAYDFCSEDSCKIITFVAIGDGQVGSTATSSALAVVTQDVVDAFVEFGIAVTQTMSYVTELVVENLFAGAITANEAEFNEVTTDDLIATNGITTIDRATGEAYCIFIENGLMQSEQGACTASGSESSVNSDDSSDTNQGGGSGGSNNSSNTNNSNDDESTTGNATTTTSTTTPPVSDNTEEQSDSTSTTTPPVVPEDTEDTTPDTTEEDTDTTTEPTISEEEPTEEPEPDPEPVEEPEEEVVEESVEEPEPEPEPDPEPVEETPTT